MNLILTALRLLSAARVIRGGPRQATGPMLALTVLKAVLRRSKRARRGAATGGAAALGLGLAALAITRAARPEPLDLAGKVVLITGGSRGLGLALARRFGSHGARLAICARSDDELRRAEEDLADRGYEVFAGHVDITDADAVMHFVKQVVDRYGRIDVLVNNAGNIQVGPQDSMTLSDYRSAMNTIFFGTLHFILAVQGTMRGQGSGRIVNISSIGGKIAVPHLLPYTASKFAVTGLSEGLRAELRKDGIVVTTILPGLMRTGSPRNADFKGKHTLEYAWFSLGDNMPLLSIPTDRATEMIIDATRKGRAEVVLGVPYQLAASFHDLFPEATANLMSVVNRFLPASGGNRTISRKGHESETAATQRGPLARIKDRAEVAHNQRPASRA